MAAIYADGIATGNATFETAVPSWEAWDAGHLVQHRLVVEDAGRLLGWAALSPVSDRCCYAGVAEGSVYVSAEARGKGVGTVLLREHNPAWSRFAHIGKTAWCECRCATTGLA